MKCDEETMGLITDFFAGKNLYKYKTQIKLEPNEILRIVYNISNILEYLHKQTPPILHRDLKLENILILKNDIRLVDFGWSN